MLWMVLEAIVAVAILVVAVFLYWRDQRRGPRLSPRGRLLELVGFVTVGLAISQVVVRPLVRHVAPSIAASGTSIGKQVVTPLDHVLFAFVFGLWFAYMLARPRLLRALGVDEPVDDGESVDDTEPPAGTDGD